MPKHKSYLQREPSGDRLYKTVVQHSFEGRSHPTALFLAIWTRKRPNRSVLACQSGRDRGALGRMAKSFAARSLCCRPPEYTA